MKILMIIPSLGSGGAERITVDLCNEYASNGHQVTLCITQNPLEKDFGFYRNELNSGVNFISLNRPKGFSYKNIILLNHVIRNLKPDVIHGHLSVINYFYLLKLLHPGIRFIYTIHNILNKKNTALIHGILQFLYYFSGLIRVVTISEVCKKSYEHFYKLNNAVLILNGRKKTNLSDKIDDVRKEIESLKKRKQDLVFIHVARYHSDKNQQVLIDVFNNLKHDFPDYVLIILGDWDFSESSKQLKTQAGEKIYFAGVKNNVSDYLSLSDAFCLSSRYEGLPISLIEAISMGCVPVCTPAGGIVEIVNNEVSGFLSDNFTYESYMNAVKNYIRQKDKIHKEDLINYFINHLSIEVCASKYLNEYQRNRK